MVQASSSSAREAPGASGCSWTGPPVEWVLARHPDAGEISGGLHSDIVPYLRGSGIPLSFVTETIGDERVGLRVGPGTTVEDVIKEIVRQVPQYRYGAVDGRIVIYPQGEVYDRQIDLGEPQSLTRAAAYFFVLRALREKTSAFQRISPGLSGGGAGWGKRPLADIIEVGGSRSLIGHLVSLVHKRPTESFDMAATDDGRLYFNFVRVDFVSQLELHLPPSVKVGETFEAGLTAKLADGSLVSLTGPDCGVTYATNDPEALKIDDGGHGVARKKGVWRVAANYEALPDASAEVRVE
jgi:hypothetical protein